VLQYVLRSTYKVHGLCGAYHADGEGEVVAQFGYTSCMYSGWVNERERMREGESVSVREK
jgi:hypothetical protein